MWNTSRAIYLIMDSLIDNGVRYKDFNGNYDGFDGDDLSDDEDEE